MFTHMPIYVCTDTPMRPGVSLISHRCHQAMKFLAIQMSVTELTNSPSTLLHNLGKGRLFNFTKWIPKAGNTCASLWANAYACVSIIGYTPKPSSTPTPTKPPNGIQTPTPIQNGMATNCNKFHFVETGNTCPVIQPKYKVTLADLVRWNPAIKADCSGLWARTYLCVGTL
ncbi:hypothetical protein H112_05426 [Trichophyton rubrum D6]|uniref:LysM domain-containing protein n=2 Tax=Trichophyton TaxID=5550 RepID=A0A022VYS3_TRIRU|nr:hypothetical protein H100_05445 [Trichophyton rubrum MR850]EZF40643.1 hypothetical protein H102_05409 [Trichophyton rubrum CBS 100081]EZF51225.1 hypothetical protein H103_05438 [Trichophyton rubrum CBS 288.86]EZF61860.1 hypothetical protein H104_05425 [Trichophyton rubrum CBS 289.86]EZF72407.1 hypothetical protein H105_05453 [Trichophyton soudanense CBS 452.61]EZF83115.1 hypothetical protein H110_05433 [Trichophyton rubrum MR1448]EZF93821.1 hypothetical protein H113_05479 [Trichophyton rub